MFCNGWVMLTNFYFYKDLYDILSFNISQWNVSTNFFVNSTLNLNSSLFFCTICRINSMRNPIPFFLSVFKNKSAKEAIFPQWGKRKIKETQYSTTSNFLQRSFFKTFFPLRHSKCLIRFSYFMTFRSRQNYLIFRENELHQLN